MRKYNLVVLTLFSIILGIDACTAPDKSGKSSDETNVKYATRFDYNESELIIKEPWPGSKTPQIVPLDKAPERVVVTSTTHLPYLELLGVENTLVGFPNTAYIYSPIFRANVQNGYITDLGPDGSINLELLLSIKPDLVIAFDMGSESSSLDKIKEAGIAVVYNADYLETSILGRAEWIKAFGRLFHKETQANSIFEQIESRYLELADKTQSLSDRPTVFSGIMYGDTWFLPGGNNWSAQLIEDAGGQYLWENNESNGWLEISFESVFEKANQADFWLGAATINSLSALSGQDERYGSFEAFRQQKVYNYSKRISRGGGYDYFESGYARPDLVLADLITILHPELLPDHELYYYEALK